MISVLLNREGWKVGKDLVYRLYKEEGLGLRKRPVGRRRAVVRTSASPVSFDRAILARPSQDQPQKYLCCKSYIEKTGPEWFSAPSRPAMARLVDRLAVRFRAAD
jgi:hypothetical protein